MEEINVNLFRIPAGGICGLKIEKKIDILVNWC